MANISVQQLIDGLYIAFYNRAADQPGYQFWESQVNLTQPQANSTVLQHQNYAFASPLGEQFFSTQSSYFNSVYAPLGNSAFINQIYINFGGNSADADGLAYWTNLLGSLSRQQVALRIAQDFLTIDLSKSTNLTAAELAAAQARQQTFFNKVAVSESFAAASATSPFLVAATASSTDPAFTAAIDIVQGITAAASTVTAAQALITAAVAAGNVQPIVLANTRPVTVALTLNADAVTGSGVGSDVITAPVIFNAGTGTQLTTLQTGDSITETGPGNVLNLTVGAPDKTIAGATISGVQTLNVTNSGYAGAPPILQGAGITGLAAVNNVTSTQAVTVGSAASPLGAALSAAGVQGTAATANTTQTRVVIDTAALAGATDALTVSATNAGSATVPARVLVGPATGANGYEAITVAAAGTDFVGIGNPLAGANTTASLAVTGAGAVSIFGDGAANDFTSLATIDATASTGGVTVTGAATAGAGAGLLAGDTAVKTVKGGAGGDVVDLSSMTLAQLSANATTVDLGAGRDTLVVDNTVATTTSALGGVSNVEVIGDRNPGATAGTVDFSKLPATVNGFTLFGNQGANAIALANGPGALTFDASTFGGASTSTTVAAAGTGTADVLNLVEGSATTGNVTGQFYAATGYETVNVTSQGGLNTLFQILATASAGGAETLNIGGTTPLRILGPTTGSAVVLSGNNTTINITNTGLTTLATTSNTGSTNAQTINAQTSGGLVMGGAETGNVLAAGQAIFGSTVAGKANILIGSPGNDAITSGAAGDVINTDGGADTVTLAAAHVASHVELYGVNNNATVQTLGAVQGAAAGSIVNAADQAGPGFWGQAPGAAPLSIFTLFPGTTAANGGTSADQANIKSFIAGAAGDSIDISLSSFTAAAATHKGLVGVDGATAAAPGNAQITSVGSGTTLTGTASDLVILSGQKFANAAELAAQLKSGGFGLTLAGPTTAGNVTHQLFGYDDAAGNGHIADVAVLQSAAATRTYAGQTNVAASDMAQLTGVSVASLVPNNVHIVA